MPLVAALFDPMLEAAGSTAVTASLHSALPDAGSDELSGGSYARQSISWDAASGGQIDASSQLSFEAPGGSTVTYLGLWDGSDNWLGSILLSNQETYGADGTYIVMLLRLTQTDTAAA